MTEVTTTMTQVYRDISRIKSLSRGLEYYIMLECVSNLRVYQQKPYTFAVFDIRYPDAVIEADVFGFSKVMWPDRWDEETGIEIAIKRGVRKSIYSLPKLRYKNVRDAYLKYIGQK